MSDKKIDILYVDDEENNLISFKATFRLKYNIMIAVSADAAMKILETKPVEIIITDQRMPNMTGIDFVREIRALYGPASSGVPLIMVTSEKTMGKVQEALDDAGADAFISKPFTVADMRALLTQHFPQWRPATL